MNKNVFAILCLATSFCYGMRGGGQDIYPLGNSLSYSAKDNVYLLRNNEKVVEIPNTLKLPPQESLKAYFENTRIFVKPGYRIYAVHPLKGGGPSESMLNAKKREGGDREDQRKR
jgi:hypothetical protein